MGGGGVGRESKNVAAVTSRPRSHRPERVIFQARFVEVLLRSASCHCGCMREFSKACLVAMRGCFTGSRGGPLEGLQVPSSVRDWRPFTLRPTRPSNPETGVRIAHFTGFRGQGFTFHGGQGLRAFGGQAGFHISRILGAPRFHISRALGGECRVAARPDPWRREP